jgi:hypothetical protein
MQSHPQDRIDTKSEPSPMAIIGAILAQGAIRWMDRQKREHGCPSVNYIRIWQFKARGHNRLTQRNRRMATAVLL